VDRVLIVDFDVHHGNGTQEIFYADKEVFYISSHAYPFYPGSGAAGDVGLGEGKGFTLNLPLPPEWGDAEYAALYREIVEPVGRAFEPDLVIVSAGFDPHVMDPLAGMNVTEAGFAAVARSCLAAAEHARGAIFVLEGGYALPAIAASGAAVVRELVSETPGGSAEVETTAAGRSLVSSFRAAFAPYWPVLG
jgi:acetoin utilization deacetylase AcuC-like enzyme